MKRVLILLIGLGLSLGPVTPAHARCHGAVVLGTLHDAYRAALLESGTIQRSGALTLLFIVGDQDAGALTRQVARSGVSIPEDQMDQILKDANSLASILLHSDQPQEIDEHHQTNIDFLQTAFDESRCKNSAVTASPYRGPPPPTPASQTQSKVTKALKRAAPTTQLLIILAALAGLAAAGYGAYAIWTSGYLKRKRVERLPRKPVSLIFDLTYTDAENGITQCQVEAIDMSAGGMKLAWPEPPPSGTTITLSLPVGPKLGQIAWSNLHYAGIMFQDRLSTSELVSLRKRNEEENGAAD